MKKSIILICALSLIIMGLPTATAANDSRLVEIKELGIQIKLLDDWYYFLPGVTEYNPNLIQSNASYEVLLDQLNRDNTIGVLYIQSTASYIRIHSSTITPLASLRYASLVDVQILIDEYNRAMESDDYMTHGELLQHPDIPLVLIKQVNKTSNVQTMMEINTVDSNQLIVFSLLPQPVEGITETENQLMYTIAENVRFLGIPMDNHFQENTDTSTKRQYLRMRAIGLSFETPDGWYVVTKDTTEDDAVIEYLQIPIEQIDELILFNKSYAHLFVPDLRYEISIVYIKSSSTQNYNELSHDKLLSKLDDLTDPSGEDSLFNDLQNTRNEEDRVQIQPISGEIYNHPDLPFLKIYSTRKTQGQQNQLVQYFTSYQGYHTVITFVANDEQRITLDNEKLLDEFMSSIKIYDNRNHIKLSKLHGQMNEKPSSHFVDKEGFDGRHIIIGIVILAGLIIMVKYLNRRARQREQQELSRRAQAAKEQNNVIESE